MILKVQRNFSAAHFYNQPQWTEQKNRAEFGKCYSPYGHGHNYLFEIEFELQVPGEESQLFKICDQLQGELDHRHLNFDLKDFKSQIPTSENISLWIAQKFQEAIESFKLQGSLRKIRLFETAEIWVELRFPAS